MSVNRNVVLNAACTAVHVSDRGRFQNMGFPKALRGRSCESVGAVISACYDAIAPALLRHFT
jgi:hypothetical protein